MERGQSAAERDLGVSNRAALLDPLEHQKRRDVRHRQDLRNADPGSPSDPGEPSRLGAEVIRRWRRVGLGKDLTSVVEIETERGRNVAPVHARRTHDTGVELGRDVLENLLHQPGVR